MIEINNRKNCSGCGACASSCPIHCIEMSEDAEGFIYPKVDAARCVDCRVCEKVCPIINPTVNDKGMPDTYYAVNKNDKIRMRSSSGGVFSALAEHILANGGTVFGAVFKEDFSGVCHTRADNVEKLSKMRGSKYIQSSIGNSYLDAKTMLDSGKTVLFTGTPCQVAGLKAYLGKEYENLFTQDFICHGVPSPKVWRNYADLQRKKAHGQISGVAFRNKTTGWKNYSLSIDFNNKRHRTSNLHKDLFMRGFLSNLYLRPSCYNCSFRGENRMSDISLADFWGLSAVLPEKDDDKGASLVLVNSSKGDELIKAIGEKLDIKEVDAYSSLIHNSAYSFNPSIPKNREYFMKNVSEKTFKRLIIGNTPVPVWKIIRPKIKKIVYVAARNTGTLKIYKKMRGEKK